MTNKIPHWKHLIFSIIPLIMLLLVVEFTLRAVFYQKYAGHALAIAHGISKIRVHLNRVRAEKEMTDIAEELGFQDEELAPKEIWEALYRELYTECGKELLAKFQTEYEEHFKTLVNETDSISSKLVVLYLPSDDYTGVALHRRDISRNFYHQLTQKYNLEYIDLTEEFSQYPVDRITLLPENGHLSRFGNKIVVENSSTVIDKYTNYRSQHTFNRRPELFGDLTPAMNTIWNFMPTMPYPVITNAQGLRMEYDLTFPKQRQRILILGDSYTFGPYLPNHHCYPNLLDKKYPEKEIINAGIAGYTILDELALFTERAKYVEPDITILQVLDNDLYGFFYFQKNLFDRNKQQKQFTPSSEEIRFITSVRQSLSIGLISGECTF